MFVPVQVQLNTIRPRQYGQHFPDDIFKCIFWNENVNDSITFSLKFVPKGAIGNNAAFVSDDGLVPNKWQAIILANDGLVWWRIYIRPSAQIRICENKWRESGKNDNITARKQKRQDRVHIFWDLSYHDNYGFHISNQRYMGISCLKSTFCLKDCSD